MLPTQELLEKIYQLWQRDNVPNISRENALYLRKLIQSSWAKTILEIGTAHGYSCIHFADQVCKIWGHVTTIEFSQIAYEIAAENIAQSGVSDCISQYFWDAREIIPFLEASYDFIFIDGLKKASLDFLKLVWNKRNPWAIIVIDDVIKFRYKMENLYAYLEQEKIDYEIQQIDADDGIMIIRSLENRKNEK